MIALTYAVILLLLRLCTALCFSFTISNNCQNTLWPATLAGAGTPQLPMTGLRLNPGQTAEIPAPPRWSGRIWARTGCVFDENGRGACETGDCDGKLECNGIGAQPPVTLFEITLGDGQDKDFYDVSVVDGYNLPVLASPKGVVGQHCNATGCVADLNSGCPRELQLERDEGGVMACRSACEAFRLDQYCCSGEFANPDSCRPSFYSSIFKTACPSAYSYAFDDGTSTFTCNARDYTITFCPTVDRSKRSNGLPPGYPFEGGEYGDGPEEMDSSATNIKFKLSHMMLVLLFCWIIN